MLCCFRIPAVASIGLLLVACSFARAADYEMVVSGPLLSAFSDSSTFDGTNHGTLPPILDLAALDGGSFTATFRFSTVTPLTGDFALYDLPAPAGMTSFDLRNSSGAVVHHGSDPFEANAIVQDNVGSPPFVVDQVLLGSSVSAISGSAWPVPIYSASGDVFSVSDVSFSATLNGDNYISDLSIPTSAATYLAFPDRVFDVVLEFGDGDYINRVGPYQLVDTMVQYQIAGVTVTPVPESGLIWGLLPAVSLLARRTSRQ